MLIRGTSFPVDVTLCAMQGCIGAKHVNLAQKATVINPSNATICFAGISFAERFVYRTSHRFLPMSTPFLLRKAVSHGLATYTTLKAMQVAGLILSIPSISMIAGSVGALLLIKTAIVYGGRIIDDYYGKTLDQRVEKHVASKTFADGLFLFKEGEKGYWVRIICNPERKAVILEEQGCSVERSSRYIIIWDQSIPQSLRERIRGYAKAFAYTFDVEKDSPWLSNRKLEVR